jgi:hypothetical protein
LKQHFVLKKNIPLQSFGYKILPEVNNDENQQIINRKEVMKRMDVIMFGYKQGDVVCWCVC